MAKKYHVEGREEGRGPKYVESFETLDEAQHYIEDRWQGPDYIDGPESFHTDYMTYRLVGFTLFDIGTREWIDDG